MDEQNRLATEERLFEKSMGRTWKVKMDRQIGVNFVTQPYLGTNVSIKELRGVSRKLDNIICSTLSRGRCQGEEP